MAGGRARGRDKRDSAPYEVTRSDDLCQGVLGALGHLLHQAVRYRLRILLQPQQLAQPACLDAALVRTCKQRPACTLAEPPPVCGSLTWGSLAQVHISQCGTPSTARPLCAGTRLASTAPSLPRLAVPSWQQRTRHRPRPVCTLQDVAGAQDPHRRLQADRRPVKLLHSLARAWLFARDAHGLLSAPMHLSCSGRTSSPG